jgi:UDP-N-acetylmuramate dehydrogenase
MHLQKNTSLKPFNTFGVDVKAKEFCQVGSVEELAEVLRFYKDQEVFILGGGSNMLLRSDLDRPVIHINIKGVEVLEQKDKSVIVRAMAGENWHEFVLWCLQNNFGGLENLSLIPGNVGAAPIQNIGAYGVEMKDHFVSCEVMDLKDQTIKTFFKKDCDFGYRESVFKNRLKGKVAITSVSFRLSTQDHRIKTTYGAIEQELSTMGVEHPGIKEVSDAVIAIRSSKLPDPSKIGNSGSFFKNPVISQEHYRKLKEQFPEMPGYNMPDGQMKVPAGWLIEMAGFKGKRFGDYGVHTKQALVLVNYGGATGSEIYTLAQLIKKTVSRIFEIDIEMEVNII